MNLNFPFAFHVGPIAGTQFDQIKKLQERCEIVDGYTMPIYEQNLFPRDSFLLSIFCCQVDRLIGYAGIFFFNLDSPEVVILVDPDYRGNGIASRLLQTIKEKLLATSVKRFLLANIDPLLNPVIRRKQGECAYAELYMEMNVWIKKNNTQSLVMKKVKSDEIEQIVWLHQSCFSSAEQYNRERFLNNIKNLNYAVYFFYFKNELVGKLHAREDREIALYDICVLPIFQKKGFGRALMEIWYQSIGCKSKKSVLLELREDNQQAFRLYKSCGFDVKQRVEFWAISNSKVKDYSC